MPTVPSSTNFSSPLNVLLVSNTDTSTHIYGADRDWVNLFNALGPERVRVTWAGIHASQMLSNYLDDKLAVRFLDLDFLPFYDLLHQSMYRQRSMINWAGIVREQIAATRRTVNSLRAALAENRPD